MQRLIDANALKDYFQIGGDETSCEGCEHLKARGCYEERLLSDFCSAIDEQPTIDAMPVVRCKDCKYYEEQDETIGTCLLTESGAHIKGYCSWAEVKEE